MNNHNKHPAERYSQPHHKRNHTVPILLCLTSGPLPLPNGSLRHKRRPRPEATLQPLRAMLGEGERRQEAQQLSDGVWLTTPRGPCAAG